MSRCDTNRDLFDKRILRLGKDIIAERQDRNKVTTHDLLIMMLKKNNVPHLLDSASQSRSTAVPVHQGQMLSSVFL